MNKRGNVLLSVLIGVLAASLLGLTTDEIVQRVYVPINSTSGSMRVTLTGGAAATSMTVGTTTIVGGSNGQLLYDNAGVLGERVNPLAIGFGGTGASSLTGSRCLQTNAGGTAVEVAAAACGTGAGTVTGSGTAGLMPIWSTTTALGDSNAFPILVANEGATGTTVNKLAKFTSAGTAIITAAAETAGILGVVKGGAGTTGSAQIITIGGATCISDNATTAGHYAIVSASTAGSCSNSGSSTFPAAGTQVIGVWSESGIAGARALFFGTPDVASASSGGGGGGAKNPAGAAGDVQYRATGNNFAAEAGFNYSESLNVITLGASAPQILLRANALSADGSTNWITLTGTMPTTPSTAIAGTKVTITSAGSASQLNQGMLWNYNAGYTGSSDTTAMQVSNAAASTGTALNLGVVTRVGGNTGFLGSVSANTTGNTIAVMGSNAAGSTGLRLGGYFRTISASASTNIGTLGNAAGSTEATNFKDVAGYFTLNTALIAGSNTSVALLADNGAVAAPIFNAYDNGTLVASIVDGGVIDADIGILGPVPTAQTVAAGNTIAADACGGIKRITASSGVTTDTTNTFTAPAAANAGCAMKVCNEGANAITLDDNANFHSPANADFAVAAGCCIPVASSGASGFWRATATGVCAD